MTSSLPAVSAQIERLVGLGVHELAGMSATAVRRLPGGSDGGLFALHPNVVSASALTPLLQIDGRRAFVVTDMDDLDDFDAVMALPAPPAYLLDGLERGDAMRNWSPAEAAPAVAATGRTPLLVTEGLYWLLQRPDVLQRGSCFMTIGSRKRRADGTFDARTPALWISNGTGRDGAELRDAPKVGWCWWGNRHTWLGMASATGRRQPDR